MTSPKTRLDEFLQHPRRAVWSVSAPMMGGMLLMVLVTVVETAFVGRLGSAALAALTLVLPLFFTLIAIVNGVGTGITALVAQAIGRRDLREAERVAGTAIALGLVAGGIFGGLGLAGGHVLLGHLGATAEVFELAWSYFLVLALASPVVFVSAFLRFVLNGEGDARTPMVIMAGVLVVNAVLDWVFIFPLGRGLQGAAIAAAVAQVVGAAILLWLLLVRRRNVVRMHWRSLWPEWRAVRSVLAIGIPNSLTQLSMAVGAMLLNRAIASFGDSVLAAAGIGQRVDQVALMPIMGLAAGSVAVIGMFAGAGRADLVRSITLYAGRWAVVIAAVLGTAAFAGSGQLMRAFTTDAAAVAVGQHYLLYMVFAYPFMGAVMVAARVLLGLNFPNLSLLIVVVRLFVIAVPVAYVAVFVLGTSIDGVWAGLVSGNVGAVVMATVVLRTIVWRRDPTERAARRPLAEPRAA